MMHVICLAYHSLFVNQVLNKCYLMVVKRMAMTGKHNGNDHEDDWDGEDVIPSGKPSLTLSSPLEIGIPSSITLHKFAYFRSRHCEPDPVVTEFPLSFLLI